MEKVIIKEMKHHKKKHQNLCNLTNISLFQQMMKDLIYYIKAMYVQKKGIRKYSFLNPSTPDPTSK